MPIWEFLETYGARIASGTLITSVQFGLATVIAVVAALIAGLGKLSHNWLIRGSAVVYIEIFRGTSLHPAPPVESKKKCTRYFHIHEKDVLDEKLVANWIRQASKLPGENCF